jgi:CheY-like chemotaxis protein
LTLRILIVDDVEDTAVSTAYLIQTLGHTVKFTTRPLSALELALSFKPHIAFLDIGMPGLDGLSLCQALKGETALDGIRCYAISGYGSEADVHKASAAGFDDIFVKPVSLDQLKSALRGA